ncbi:protein bicaudal C homolog 1-like [Amphibalanus amphitrite]|uniref:protein bicaudal C homolog 1-like n=1 Tax=Amphibalanus amphitrite TaxID=1232801 RepID=UPI001C8FCEB5|nr:protein bicaudal C homolog 1-like [Amphibalanus amphitrite]
MRLEEMRRPPSGQGEAEIGQEDRLSDGSTDRAMSQDARSVDSQVSGDLADLDLGELEKVERVKVDRKKLEDLLYGSPVTVEEFFMKIESDTNTRIQWPRDCSSKRDPQVRVIGLSSDVDAARSIIHRELGIRNMNRASLKVDVSYTDHSHMIGVGGKCSKDLSNRTNCHIHFPDCNKQADCDKSNCVSLSGEIPNIEYARIGVRLLQPLVFIVTLPHSHPLHRNGTLRETKDIPDPWKTHIEWAENRFGVKVNPKAKSSNQYTALFIKGSEENSENIQAATEMIINELVHRYYPHEPGHVTNSMEISIHHHKIVQGNVKLVMQRTGAVILFPDAEDRNIPQQKKSSVVICGTVRAVYRARQMLIGSLPIKMTFEMQPKPDTWWPDQETLRQMEIEHDVSISVPQKNRDNAVLVTVMAMERNIGGVYAARRDLLGLSGPTVVPGVPACYRFDGAPRLQGPHGLLTMISHQVRRTLPPFSPVWPPPPPPPSQHGPAWSPLAAALGASSPLAAAFGSSSYGLQTLGELGSALGDVNANGLLTPTPGLLGSFAPEFSTGGTWGATWTGGDRDSAATYSQPVGVSSALSQFIQNATMQQNVGQDSTAPSYDPLGGLGLHPTSATTSATTVTSIGDPLNSSGGSQGFNSSQSSSRSATRSNTPPSDEGMDRRAPGYEKKLLSTLVDYEEKRALAAKMRRAPVVPKPRTPTDVWSGYGFSRSSPHWLLKEEMSAVLKPEPTATSGQNITVPTNPVTTTAPSAWPSTNGSAVGSRLGGYLSQSNVFDCGALSKPANPVRDLAELLEGIDGLRQYSELFRDEEIDLPVFIAMTEDDLKKLGVKTVGGRKKLMMLIQTFNSGDLKLPGAVKSF